MADEFDDDMSGWMTMDTLHHDAAHRHRRAAPRLVSRLYQRADDDTRAQVLSALLRPLTPLSLLAVASGAFATFMDHRPRPGDPNDLGAMARISTDQIAALTEFVDQVDHRAIEQVAALMTLNAANMVSFHAALASALVRSAKLPHDQH